MKSWEWDDYNKKLGHKEGLEKGIQANISTCRKFNASEQDILTELMSNFSLTEEDAKAYLEKYSN